jgi:hypothetical protein
MNRALLLITLGITLSAVVGSTSAQQRPLITELPEPVGEGRVRVEVGMDLLQRQRYPLSGLQGDAARLGVLGARIGLGSRIEFQITGTARTFLNVKERGPGPFSSLLGFTGNATSAAGDFAFATKIRLLEESGAWPALAFRLGAQLPNTSNESGLGIDTTRTFGEVLAGKRIGRGRVFSSLGVAIIDDPTRLAAQSDKLSYGLAILYPVSARLRLAAEVQGLAGSSHPGTEDTSIVRLGTQVSAAGFTWDVAALAGLRRSDARSGLIFGISREIEIFRPPAGRPQSAERFNFWRNSP